MAYISSGLVVGELGLTNPNLPRICYNNIATSGNVLALNPANPLFPVSNLTNPSTSFTWKPADNTGTKTIIVTTNGINLNYLGFARHNLTGGAQVRVLAQAVSGGATSTIIDWTTINNAQQSVLFLLNELSPFAVWLEIRNNPVIPSIAVLRCGMALTLPYGIYVGHTPINMGRSGQKIGGDSESGQYLGEVTRRRSLNTSVDLQNLNPIWYRENLDPIIGADPREPFFWAWRPEKYPQEVGYAWIKGYPRPTNQRANGMMQLNFDIGAIV